MGLKKILEKLYSLIDEDNDTGSDHCDEIRELLEKLAKKQSKLQDKIAREDKGSKLKSLKLDLKITEAELKKGEQLMRSKCPNENNNQQE